MKRTKICQYARKMGFFHRIDERHQYSQTACFTIIFDSGHLAEFQGPWVIKKEIL